jgi:hypothetical protein
MKKYLIIALHILLSACAASHSRTQSSSLDRDVMWDRCSFYILDRDCGTITSLDEQRECSLESQADYFTVSPGQRMSYLRMHGCPRSVLAR